MSFNDFDISKKLYYRDKVINNNKRKFKNIIREELAQYYKGLYVNLEMKTVGEISDELNVSKQMVFDYINSCCDFPEHSNVHSVLTTIIMVCTKFEETYKLYPIQQERFGKLIKRRMILKELKIRNEKLNQKRR